MAYVELPVCLNTYSTASEKDCREKTFQRSVHKALDEQFHDYLPFFLGVCYHCWAPRYIPGYSCKLLRCSGCQLVAYCSKICQKANWSRHKYVCKEFPVVKGKNVLCTKESWKKHIASLRTQAAKIPHAKPIFHNPRVCRSCKDAQQESLTDCRCMCVSYCSKKCIKADKQHQNNCEDLLRIAQVYSTRRDKYIMPSIMDNTVCDKFTPVTSWNNVIPHKYTLALLHYSQTEEKGNANVDHKLITERLSYPMSLLYALQLLPKRVLSSSGPPLEVKSTLDIHVVTSLPLYDSEPWEIFMHCLPELKELNIVYINQGRTFRQSQGLLRASLGRCHDCEHKGRVINYSVHQMPYHMFFSSPEYTDPDVVVIYGNEHEMSSAADDCINREISYRNMTHSLDTVLVLMDAIKDQVFKGVKAVNAVQSVDQLVPPSKNRLSGPSSNRAEVESVSDIINEKSFFTCLRRKQNKMYL